MNEEGLQSAYKFAMLHITTTSYKSSVVTLTSREQGFLSEWLQIVPESNFCKRS